MGSAAAETFSKEERLCGKAAVSALVSGGKWGGTAHLRYCWLRHGDDSRRPSRILVSVPKRYFKRAVRRNLLKRRIREAYRTQKALLGCDGVDFMLAWSSKECCDWQTVRGEVAAALTRIGKAARQHGSGQQNDSAR